MPACGACRGLRFVEEHRSPTHGIPEPVGGRKWLIHKSLGLARAQFAPTSSPGVLLIETFTSASVRVAPRPTGSPRPKQLRQPQTQARHVGNDHQRHDHCDVEWQQRPYHSGDGGLCHSHSYEQHGTNRRRT